MNGLYNVTNGQITLTGNSAAFHVTSNIVWIQSFNPYNRPGYVAHNASHTVCLTNNITVSETCCSSLNGTFVDSSSAITTKNSTDSRGFINWCEIQSDGVYNDHYISQPASVTAFIACYNKTVPASRHPLSIDNLTTESILYQCEVTGNFNGSSSFLPSLPTATSGGIQRVSYGGLGIVGMAMVAWISCFFSV